MSSETENTPDEIRGFDAYEVRLGDHLRGERATRGKSLLDVQRELRIRASYIAAIENCDIEVFPNKGFIAGYVRSYARYLKLDPEEVFHRFCGESGFGGVNAGLSAKKTVATGRIVASGPLRVKDDDPLLKQVRVPAADLRPSFSERLSFSAISSMLVLLGLVGGVGYGGYYVLQSVQRVTITPVDQRPDTLVELAELSAPGGTADEVALLPIPSADAPSDLDLTRLYQPLELDVPVVEARDGPIVDINPDQSGLYAVTNPPTEDLKPDPGLLAAASLGNPQVREAISAPVVNVVARQPAWVRVYQADGTVLFEKILDPGETYTLPSDAEAPLLRAGNSGSVYLLVNDGAYGPLGNAASVAKDVSLLPSDIRDGQPLVTDLPDVIQASVSALNLTPTAE